MVSAGAQSESSRFSSWLKNIGLGYADLAVGAAIYIALTPLLIRHLGVEAYAVWIISHTVTFYLGFLDLGITQAQVRFHAKFAARERHQSVAQLLATSAALLSIAGAIAAIIAVALALLAPMQWLEIPSSLASDFRVVIAILGVNLLVAFPGSVLTSAYEGAQRFDLAATRSICIRILTASAQLWALLQGHGLLTLAVLELLASVLRLVVDLFTLPRLLPGALQERVRAHAGIWKRIRTFAIWSSVDDLIVEGTARLDQVLIVALLPLSLLTPYALCMTVGAMLMVLVEPIVETFFPMAAGLHAHGKRAELQQLLLSGTKVVVAIATPIAVFLVFFGEAAMTLWVPEIEQDLPAGLLPLVVANMLVSVFMWTPNLVLMALNQVRALALLTLAEVLLALVLIVALVPTLGLNGIALGALIANIAAGLFLQLPLLRGTVGIPITSLVTSSLGRVLLAASPAAAIAYWLVQRYDNAGWLHLIVAAAIIGVVYAVGLWLVGFNRIERDKYFRIAMTYLKAQVPGS